MKQYRKDNKSGSIKAKLLSIMGILFIVICCINMAVNGMIISNKLTESENEKLSNVAKKSAETVNRVLENRITMLKGVARKSEFQTLAFDSEEVTALLSIEKEKLGFTNIFMASTEGQMKMSDEYEDVSGDPIYKAALKGESSYSDPMIRPTSVIVNLATPVMDMNGKVIGVIIATQVLDTFSELVIDDLYISFIMDDKGQYIAHSMPEMLDTEAEEDRPVYEENNAVKEAFLNTEAGIAEWHLETNGEHYYMAYEKVPMTGWTIGVLENKDIVIHNIYTSIISSIMVISIFLVLGLIFMYGFITKYITNNIEKMTKHLGVLASGDFKTKVDQKLLIQNDEIGMAARAMNEMRKSTGSMINALKEDVKRLQANSNDLNEISKNTYVVSSEISTATQEIAASVQSEAIDLSEVLESINEFGKKIEEIVGRITTITMQVSETNEETVKGNENANQLNLSVEEVNKSFSQFIVTIEGLSKNITKVTDITMLINGIASQTNLLALNASIEAARAGEAGKGFAVVAEEIRKLADECKNSADNISAIIQEVSVDAQSIIGSSQYLDSEIKNQKDIIDQTVKIYGNITVDIKEVTRNITDIEQFVNEIDQDKNSIVAKVENSAALSEEISATTQEVAASAKEMQSSSDQVGEAAAQLMATSENITSEVKKFEV